MSSLSNLLSKFEESKRQFGAGNAVRTERLLERLEKRRFSDPESLIRFHEALLFIRSHPQSANTFRVSERILSTFARRVDELRSSGVDLTCFDYIEYSGIAGTVINGSFSYDIARFLAGRYPARVEIDWNACEKPERLSRALPQFLPLLYEDSLVEANIPYLDWLRAAVGKRRQLHWLLRRIDRTGLSEKQKSALFDSLELRIKWDLADSRASRTLNKRRVQKVSYHTTPLVRRSEVSLDKEFQSPPLDVERLSRRRGKAMQDMLREVTTVRYRELYGITHGDPDSVLRASVGRGVEIFLWGLPPPRRLPLRAYHAGFTLKNGVPVNYIEGITICERMEIGFNTFYTFREGESAWVYAQVLRLLHQVVGAKCISIDPYQLGFNNEEAIESGAFWFYRKLGFRPTRPELMALMESEEEKITTTPNYRTPARVLRRLSRGNVVYEAPGSPRGDWDRFSIRNIGLAVQRRMAKRFGSDPESMSTESAAEVAQALEIEVENLSVPQRRSFYDLALMLALIPNLSGWSKREKKQVVRIIHAKEAPDESVYARLLQSHSKLRAAIIKIGETQF